MAKLEVLEAVEDNVADPDTGVGTVGNLAKLAQAARGAEVTRVVATESGLHARNGTLRRFHTLKGNADDLRRRRRGPNHQGRAQHPRQRR
jgi:hypothetical protein